MLEIFPDILSRGELKAIRKALDADEFVDGRKTAGFRAKQVKNNQQMAGNAAAKDNLNKLVIGALRNSEPFRNFAFPRTIRNPLISRYGVGMEYGFHVDDALMGPGGKKSRTDLSVTVFLNDPSEYDGGALEMTSPFGPQTVKLPAGSAVSYPSSTLHRVEPVSRGERLVAVTWVQSYVRDPAQREILSDMDSIRRKLHADAPDGKETDLAFKTYANLLRSWSDI